MTIRNFFERKRKGVAYVWFYILISIFFIGVVYTIQTQILYVYLQPIIVPSIEAMQNSTTFNSTGAITSINTLNIVWQYWPFFFIFGLLLYGFVAGQKREPSEYGY